MPPVDRAVTVASVRSEPRGVLVPLGLWALLAGGRLVCRAAQLSVRLAPTALPLPEADARALAGWQVR